MAQVCPCRILLLLLLLTLLLVLLLLLWLCGAAGNVFSFCRKLGSISWQLTPKTTCLPIMQSASRFRFEWLLLLLPKPLLCFCFGWCMSCVVQIFANDDVLL